VTADTHSCLHEEKLAYQLTLSPFPLLLARSYFFLACLQKFRYLRIISRTFYVCISTYKACISKTLLCLMCQQNWFNLKLFNISWRALMHSNFKVQSRLNKGPEFVAGRELECWLPIFFLVML